MKKSKLLILGLIALMLAGGLALASCEPGLQDCKGKCGYISGSCHDDCKDRLDKPGKTSCPCE
jgi:hypothetical protein